jgi:hypothetical protein
MKTSGASSLSATLRKEAVFSWPALRDSRFGQVYRPFVTLMLDVRALPALGEGALHP